MKKWWHDKVIYQIYPRSFKDTNGDGIGDINGIIEKLPYLNELGIDIIWLCPVYKSPNDDNGYDISDYYDINEEFGTFEDMERLIEEGNKFNIKIMMDLVANHTSDEHKWFENAKMGSDNEYHDFYIWRDKPNELNSIFGGTAWEYIDELKAYYLHMFSKKQADLNWENENVRKEIYKLVNFWLDKGVAGFRLDVIDMISKDIDNQITSNGPKLHDYVRELSENTFNKYDAITVGETWSADIEHGKKYSNQDGKELSMVFQFEHILLDQQENKEKWDLKQLNLLDLKNVFKKWQQGLYEIGWNSLFWNNHDCPRAVSRFGNDSKEYRVVSAKMIATLLYGMQGTPYIFQGEELGMTNVKFEDISDYKDIETLNMYNERISKGYSKEEIMKSIYKKGRDNSRTPMQWSSDKNGSFTTGTPWININPNYTYINANDCLEDKNSIFYYYKKLISLRKENDIFIYGDFTPILEEHPSVFAYQRNIAKTKLYVYCNFYESEQNISLEKDLLKGNILISNYQDTKIEENITLRPYESFMILESV